MTSRLFPASLAILFATLVLALVPAGIAQAPPESNVRDTAPRGLLLTYRCLPVNRPALRDYVERRTLPALLQLQNSGVLAGKTVLFSRYVNTDNWDLLIFLDFATAKTMQEWNRREQTTPAGFDAEGLRLVTSVSTYQIDLVRTQSASVPAPHPVYLVIPYEYLVSTDAYLDYLKGYVVPQMSGWIQAGPLSSYSIFVGRGVADRPWSAVILLAYRDDEALGKRDATVAAVRATLRNDPSWKAFSDSKQKVRTEKAAILADSLQ